MELKKVKALLADYYEGKTSREDETLLTDFFVNSDVPEELEADRAIFLSLNEAVKEEIPDEQFDIRLFAAIEKSDRENRKAGMTRLFYTVSGIAAGLFILIGSYFFLVERQIEPIVTADTEYTMEETLLAYEEARNALLLVSGLMNTGTEQLELLSKFSDATSELGMINKFYEGTRELQALSKFEETKDRITIKQ